MDDGRNSIIERYNVPYVAAIRLMSRADCWRMRHLNNRNSSI